MGARPEPLPISRSPGAGERGDLDRPVRRADHAHLAVGELEVLARHLQPLGRHVEQHVADLSGGRDDGAPVVHGRLRARGAGVERGRLRVLVEDREARRIHAEHVGGQERERHHGAAAVLLRARDDRPGAVAVQLHVGARGVPEGRPPAARDADRLVLGEVALGSDQLQGPLERLPDGDRPEHLARRALGALLEQRAPAQLDGIEPERLGELVHVLLERPADLGRRRRADRARRLVVRVDERRLDVHVLDHVGPAGVHRGHLREEAALAAVGAAVEDEPAATGDERAVGARAGLELDHHPLPPVVGGDELLLAREDELHRPPRGARERGDVALVVEVALGAEAAAEQRHDDADVGLRQLQDVRDARPGRVRHLRRAPDRHLVALPLRQERARLDRRALRGVGDVPPLDDDLGLRHPGLGVALHDRRVAEDVPVAPEVLVALVGLPVRVDQRRVVGERGLDVAHGRQRLVLHLDRRGRLGGDLRRQRGDGGDDVALEAHVVPREQQAVLDEVAVQHVGDVLVGEDGEHARQRPRAGRVDREDPRVRVVGVAELRVELPGQAQVGRVPAGAGDLLLPVRPQERGPLGLGDAHGAEHSRRSSRAETEAPPQPGGASSPRGYAVSPAYMSDPGVVSLSPVSSRVLRPERIIGQPP